MPFRRIPLALCPWILFLSATPARTQEQSAIQQEAPAPRALQEQLPLQKDTPPPSPYQLNHPRRLKKIPSLLDQFDSVDEEVTPEERAKLRKEDRDPSLGNPTPGDGKKSAGSGREDMPPIGPSDLQDPNEAVVDRPEPRWNLGHGRAQLYGGGSQLQTAISGFRVEHTFWESFTLAGRAEGESDLLRSAGNYSAAGEFSWRLFRPLSISAEGGAGGTGFVNWVGGGGAISLLLDSLFDQGIDTRFSVRAASRSGTLGSLDGDATLLGFSTLALGATIGQDLGEVVTLSLDIDLGNSLTGAGLSLRRAREAQDISTRQEAIHLGLAATSRRYAPFEGAFAALRWKAGLGIRASNDLRISLEAGQLLSELTDPTLASWWVFNPRFEIDLGPRSALQLDALWAPQLNSLAATDPLLPSDLILGRIGVRLLWP